MGQKRTSHSRNIAGFLLAMALSIFGCQSDPQESSNNTALTSIGSQNSDAASSADASNMPEESDASGEGEVADSSDSNSPENDGEGPDGVEPEPDGVEPEPDGVEPEPDIVEPEPDGVEPEPDGVEPEPDGVEPEPEPEPVLDPGNITLHRLNRTEYDKSVQALLGTTQEPAVNFPADDQGYGFDNIADVLSLSPLHFELYELAARSLIDEALDVPVLEPENWFFEAEDATASLGAISGIAWNLWSVGTVSSTFTAPEDGTYRIRARLWATQVGDELAESSLLIDGEVVHTEYVEGIITDPEIIEAETYITAGEHLVAVSYNNDFWIPEENLDRNLYVDWFDVTGPMEVLDEVVINPIREALVLCEPPAEKLSESLAEVEFDSAACILQTLEGFVPRAWRRPVTSDEYAILLGLYSLAVEDGAGFDEALSVPLIATLLSPHFTFRVELDADPTDPTPHLLNNYELATRLSYFLWSSMPDELLFEAAASGTLQDPEVLQAEALRMLADPKSNALVDNFAGQWLYLRGLWDAIPDTWIFPEWNEEIRASLASEAWLFVHSFINGDRPLTELLTSSTSFVDETLATYYGMEPLGLAPGEFAEVDVTGVNRGGILRQAGLLTTLSYPTRTSPVRRGKWVLGQLLCSEPPPPPPGVEGLIEESSEEAGTLAEQLKQHSTDPACSGCHMMMDPIGLGFENFDGIGRFRLEDTGVPIDASGALPNGTEFEGTSELIDLLAEDANLLHCMSEKLMTYALGRGVENEDDPYLEDITEQFQAGGLTFSQLVLSIVTSEPFRMRRGEPVTPEPEEED